MADYHYKKIRTARLEKGWTQTELARRCGLSQSTINRAERGKHENPDTVAIIASVLELEMAELVVR